MENLVPMRMEGLDGNAFAILGAFRRQARLHGWSPESIEQVVQEAKTGDYDHLLHTIMDNTTPLDDDDDDIPY